MRILAAIVAGVAAGIVMGLGMQMMMAPAPDGGQVSMMSMVADIPLRYDRTGSLAQYNKMAVGWIYHLFNSAIIGAFFGLIFGGLIRTYRAGLGWGAFYGLIWWVLGGLTLMPLLLGMPAFAPLRMPEMRSVAVGSLMGHLIYGLILGAVYVALTRALTRPATEAARREYRRPI